MRYHKLLLVFCLVLCNLSLAASASQIQLIRTSSNHLLVPIKIEGVDTLFLVDSGSSSSVLDTNLVKKLSNLKRNTAKKIDSYAPAVPAFSSTMISISSLSVAGLPPIAAQAVEQPIAQSFAGMYKSEITGILGVDVLKQLGLSLHIGDAKLIDLTQSPLIATQFDSLPIHNSAMGLPYIRVNMNHRSVGLILDSGATEILLDQQASLKLKFDGVTYPKGLVGIDSQGNERQLGQVAKVKIQFGEQQFTNDIFLDDFSSLLAQLNKDSTTNISGIIGLNKLAEIGALLDFKNQLLYFKKAAK